MGDDSGGGGGKGGGDSKGGSSGGFDSGSSSGAGYGSAGTAGYVGPSYDSNFNPTPYNAGSDVGAPLDISPPAQQDMASTPSIAGVLGPGSAAVASVATEPVFSSGFSPGTYDLSSSGQSVGPSGAIAAPSI